MFSYLDTAQKSGGRARGIGHLFVNAVRSRLADVREAFERQFRLFAVHIRTRSGDGNRRHAVAQKEHDVLGPAEIGCCGAANADKLLGLLHPIVGV